MRNDQLLPNEDLLSFSDDGLITLTTHRIRYRNQADFVSIMLEKISAIQVQFDSYPSLLSVGVIVMLIGFWMGFSAGGKNATAYTLLVGAGFIVAYFVTRKNVCHITADSGTKIIFETKGMNMETLITMVDKIEMAKSKRMERVLVG